MEQGVNLTMVQHVATTLVDDIDGSPAERTIEFSIDGVDYEIELSTANIAELKDAVAGYVESARRVGAASRRSTRKSRTARSAGVDGGKAGEMAEIREWAKRSGYSVSDRGRLPAEVLAAWKVQLESLGRVS